MDRNAADTERLLKNWSDAERRLKDAKAEVNRCEADFANATNALGKFLTPDNADGEETFSIWVNGQAAGFTGDKMLQVKKDGKFSSTYTVKWRA